MLNMVLLFIGTTEIIVIAGVALLIFGGKKIPELMRGLGKGVKEFKNGMNDVTSTEEESPRKEEASKEAQEKEQEQKRDNE